MKPFLRLTSPKGIASVQETLLLTKTLMESPGCYAEGYLGTEVATLVRREVQVGGRKFLTHHSIPLAQLAATDRGGVQEVKILFVLEVTYTDGTSEGVVRRLDVWWPKCA